MYKQIIALDNLEKAYLKIAADMELDGRLGRYRGWDSLKMTDIEIQAPVLLRSIREELRSLQAIAPAILLKIPKKSNPQKMREIYIYNLSERIKAQAIYQVLEPVFDAYFSPYLFSYRSSHSSYFAARSAVRHYRKYWKRDSVYVADLSDYSNYIRHDCLRSKIKQMGLEKSVEELLFLFIGNEVIREGKIVKPEVGLVQGVPLIALFNNLYLDDFDKYIGPKTDFYRRVGDDLVMFDRLPERLKPLQIKLEEEVKTLGLKMNLEKTTLQPASASFNFLGYHFKSGQVSLPANYVRAVVNKWRQQFPYHGSRGEMKKKSLLQKALRRDRQNLREQFQQLADQKKLVTDEGQLRQLSEAFFRVLTRYFFENYTPRNRRLLSEKLNKMGLQSIYKYFLSMRYGGN